MQTQINSSESNVNSCINNTASSLYFTSEWFVGFRFCVCSCAFGMRMLMERNLRSQFDVIDNNQSSIQINDLELDSGIQMLFVFLHPI